MDPFLQRVEFEVAIGVADDQLAIQDPAPRREAQLREVAGQFLAAAGLDIGVLAVDEDDRPKAVELRLVGPLLAQRQLFAGQRQLRLDRRREWEGHAAGSVRDWRQPVPAARSRRARLSRGSGIGTAE